LNIGMTFLREEIKKGLLETLYMGDRQMTTREMRVAYVERKRQNQRLARASAA